MIKLFSCKWKRNKQVRDEIYYTSCGAIWDVTGQMKEAYKYCPNCGKKIKREYVHHPRLPIRYRHIRA